MTYAQKLEQWERRRKTITDLRARGWTYRKIAAKHRITIGRVQQIVKMEEGRGKGQKVPGDTV